MVKPEAFSLFFPHNVADPAWSFLTVMFMISENMPLKNNIIYFLEPLTIFHLLIIRKTNASFMF